MKRTTGENGMNNQERSDTILREIRGLIVSVHREFTKQPVDEWELSGLAVELAGYVNDLDKLATTGTIPAAWHGNLADKI